MFCCSNTKWPPQVVRDVSSALIETSSFSVLRVFNAFCITLSLVLFWQAQTQTKIFHHVCHVCFFILQFFSIYNRAPVAVNHFPFWWCSIALIGQFTWTKRGLKSCEDEEMMEKWTEGKKEQPNCYHRLKLLLWFRKRCTASFCAELYF